MDLTTITVDDFKSQFSRDFPYLPVYDNTALYNSGDRVYYETTLLFYDALVNGVTGITPDSGDPNWSTAVSDSINNYVLDNDIERAFIEAQINFNQSLFSSDAQIKLSYLYLTAHYLVMDLRNSKAGVSSTGEWNVSGRSVGSVSESYSLPAKLSDNMVLNYYTKSGYGQKYLSLIVPRLLGGVYSVGGGTNAL